MLNALLIMRGFISFHFPHKRKMSQWPKVIISHPKDISLHNPSFLLYYQFNKSEFENHNFISGY